jgi:REP element-mobilizing transposase RayT
MENKYNPDIHHRRSIRLKHYDYTQTGAYFVTVCTWQKECLFGDVVDGETRLNEYGNVVVDCWNKIPSHFQYVGLDAFIVMPNHVHVIIVMDNCRGKACLAPTWERGQFGKPITGSLPTIVGSFKSAVTKQINTIRNTPGTPLWQRNYYEHVIRNDDELQRIREYIINNPLQWADDEINPANMW